VAVVLFALTAMDLFEKRTFKERTLRKIEVIVKKKSSGIQACRQVLSSLDVVINSSGFERNVHEATDRITFIVAVTRKMDVQQLADALETIPGTVSVFVEIIH
jgi:putative Mg2+ transporter-C (MgtC) family protein